jgi:hypothetical protein
MINAVRKEGFIVLYGFTEPFTVLPDRAACTRVLENVTIFVQLIIQKNP